MGIKIKHRDPKSTDFSPSDIIVNVKDGTLFYKSTTGLFKVQGDNINTLTNEQIGDTITGSIISSERYNITEDGILKGYILASTNGMHFYHGQIGDSITFYTSQGGSTLNTLELQGGHITASGNISSSSDLIAKNITASSHITASQLIGTDESYFSKGKLVALYGDVSDNMIFSDDNVTRTTIQGNHLNLLPQHITASGHISGSATSSFTAATGSFTVMTKQMVPINFGYSLLDSHDSEVYIDLRYTIDSPYDQYYHKYLAPFDGVVKKITIGWDINNPGNTTVRFRKDAGGDFDLDEAGDIVEGVTINSCVQDTSYDFVFDT